MMRFDRVRPALALALLVAMGCTVGRKKDEASAPEKKSEAPRAEGEASSRPFSETYGLPGYAVYEQEGRLWVFRSSSDAHEEFLTKGEPAKRVTLVGEGPDGRTLMGPDRETLDDYLARTTFARRGFEVFLVDGRLWVFRSGSEELKQYRETGEPAKRITLVGAGPDGRTLLGPDRETLEAYQRAATRP